MHRCGQPVLEAIKNIYTRMLFDSEPHLEVQDLLEALPDLYRQGEQQDVGENYIFYLFRPKFYPKSQFSLEFTQI